MEIILLVLSFYSIYTTSNISLVVSIKETIAMSVCIVRNTYKAYLNDYIEFQKLSQTFIQAYWSRN